jgi:hypothetical protein
MLLLLLLLLGATSDAAAPISAVSNAASDPSVSTAAHVAL